MARCKKASSWLWLLAYAYVRPGRGSLPCGRRKDRWIRIPVEGDRRPEGVRCDTMAGNVQCEMDALVLAYVFGP